jgi:hypothetical protein
MVRTKVKLMVKQKLMDFEMVKMKVMRLVRRTVILKD